jgi:hypothetical protein
MDLKVFNTILPYKIRDAVSLIMQTEKLDFINALEYFYNSELSATLEKEDTKLWHLSSFKLAEMLLDEKKNKKLSFPDFV